MRHFALQVNLGTDTDNPIFVKDNSELGGFSYTFDISKARRYVSPEHAQAKLGKRVIRVGSSQDESWSVVEVKRVAQAPVYERVPEGVCDTLSRVSKDLKERVRI